MTHAYTPDQPIHTDQEDRLNRAPFAQRIADTVSQRVDPSSLVISINGPWGDGKTSALHLIEERLKTHDNIIRINFNPWLFNGEDNLIRGFFSDLAVATGNSIRSKKEVLGEILGKYGWIASIASTTIGTVLPTQVSAGGAVQQLSQQLSTVSLPELRTRLETILREEKKRVVVFIDDIDRLDRTEIQSIFRLVKLSAGFDWTTYILAFDEDIVASSLGERYAQGGAQAGHDFLDKIIQVPLRLPPADRTALRQMTFEGIDEALKLADITNLTENDGQRFHLAFRNGLEQHVTTPRKAKIFKNTLSFALPILKGEVHPIDQILIEGIRLFLPRLYKTILTHEDALLNVSEHNRRDDKQKQHIKRIIEEGLNELSETDRASTIHGLLEKLFPQLQGVFGNTFWGDGASAKWEQEKRISSSRYFRRYFTYGIPSDDIPDRTIAAIITLTQNTHTQELSKALKDACKLHAVTTLIQKINTHVAALSEKEATQLALAIAPIGEVFPYQGVSFTPLTIAGEAAILIFHLLLKIPNKSRRKSAALKILRTAEPLPFAAECLRWMGHDDSTSQEDRIFDDQTPREAGQILAERIKSAASISPIWTTYPSATGDLLFLWRTYAPSGEVSTYLTQQFEQQPHQATNFLLTYVPTAFMPTQGTTRKADLRRNHYDAISLLIPPDKFITYLHSQHGTDIDNGSFYSSDNVPLGRRAAIQFVHIHKDATKPSAAPSADPEK